MDVDVDSAEVVESAVEEESLVPVAVASVVSAAVAAALLSCAEENWDIARMKRKIK